MTPEERYKITSDDFVDFIIKYSGNMAILDKYKDYSPLILDATYALIFIPVSQISSNFAVRLGYSVIPHCYALVSEESLEASGITRLRQMPGIELLGKGVVVGSVDTGIDYTNPVFKHADGTTKIIAIWDQTIGSTDQYPKNMTNTPYFGTVYTAEQINQALKSNNPHQIVPSVDEIGHGTKLAGIAAGSKNQEYKFSGVVPEADLIIVKLKQAKRGLRDLFYIPKDVPCYQESDIMYAIQFIVDTARQLKRPIALGIGLGTSQGAHDNHGPLNQLLSVTSNFAGAAVSVAAGNEGGAKRHFFSIMEPSSPPVSVELNVGENEQGFSMELWGDPPTIYTLDILSPTGEHVPRILESLQENRQITFGFETTVINVNYIMVEPETGKQLILLRFRNPTQGIWKFQVYGRGDLEGAFHVWLPSDGFISTNTYFLFSDPYTTITSPGNATLPITVAAYNSVTSSLYPNSGRGFTASNIIAPDLTAPGVNIQCPTIDHSFGTLTGTSAAVAHTAGITAMILEWSIIEGNYPGIDTNGIRKFLIRGAKRSSVLEYPNRDWGYGIVDIYNSFNILRRDIG